MTGKQLKNSILQWAIQGKLVPQDPNDEPASILLEKIRAEKARLIKEGKIKKDKKASVIHRGEDNSYYEKFADGKVVCIDEEIPFEIPQGWEWCRLGEISTYAQTKKKINAANADVQLWGLDLEDIEKGGKLLYRKTVGERKAIGDKTIFNRGDILYSKLRPYLLKVLIAPESGICTPEIIPFTCYGKICKEYIVSLLKSPYVDDYINAVTYGVKMPRVGTETMTSLLVPFPPISEQLRIVAKTEQLMKYVDEYEKIQDKLDCLNEELPIILRKSLLQEAIQGKLVPQIELEETAQELLEQIKTEKQKLVKEGKLKKKDAIDSVIFRGEDNSYYEKLANGKVVCIDDEIPFEIPASWSYARSGNLCSYLHRGKSPKYGNQKVLPIIAQKCNQWDKLYIDRCLFSDIDYISKYKEEQFLQEGDIIINSTGGGTVGRTGYIDKSIFEKYDKFVADSHVTVVRPTTLISHKYIYMYLLSPYIQIGIEERCSGSTNQIELGTATVYNYIVPVPPLAEQERIVERIAKLHAVAASLAVSAE